MPDLVRDVQHAFRCLIRRPGSALPAIVTLGLGIGLTTGMFSILNSVMLRGLPVEDPEELMAVARINPSQGAARLPTPIHDYADLSERQSTFEELGAYNLTTFNLATGDGPPDVVNAAIVTSNVFQLLRTPPVLGRDFVDEDERIGALPVALIGFRFWQNRFDGAPDVLGRTVRLNGQPTQIIGIMPDDFEFPIFQQLWKPMPAIDRSLDRGTGPAVSVFGRLSDGVSKEQAQDDIGRIMRQLAVDYPDTNEGITAVIAPYVQEVIGYQMPGVLYTMLATVSMVLLIACANVANLLLARASLRSKEVALRMALGARRSQVVFQLLADSSVIAVLGAALGLGVAQLAATAFNRALTGFPQGVAYWMSIEIDVTVLLFVLLLTIGATLLSGVIPAIRASRTDVNEILKDAARGTPSLSIGRLSRGLVIGQVALSFALLVSAGLMVKSVRNLANVDYPFDGESVLTASLSLPPADYPGDAERLQFFDQLRQRLNMEAAVISASIATELPAAGFGSGRFELEGQSYSGENDYPRARIGSVDQAYFETISTGVVEGRSFQTSDDAVSTPVAVVNQRFVSRYFPGEPVLGRRVRLRSGSQSDGEGQGLKWYTIVGVAPDFYLDVSAFGAPPEAIYLPLAQRAASVVKLLVHTRGDPLQFTSRTRDIVAELDQDLPISQVDTLAGTIRSGNLLFNIFAVMFTVFGAAALLLASIGLYGVLSFNVNERTRELGVRTALGASRIRLIRLVMRQAAIQLTSGMVIGVGLSLLLGRGLSFVLFGVEAADLSVLVVIAAILSLTAGVACLVPARRATRVDPVVAMQAE